MNQDTFYFDPNETGLAVFMGTTEALLMELIWNQKKLTVKRALSLLKTKPKPAYTTVMTILNRLVEKNLLKRAKDGRHFVYFATVSREEFLSQRITTINKCLADNFSSGQQS